MTTTPERPELARTIGGCVMLALGIVCLAAVLAVFAALGLERDVDVPGLIRVSVAKTPGSLSTTSTMNWAGLSVWTTTLTAGLLGLRLLLRSSAGGRSARRQPVRG